MLLTELPSYLKEELGFNIKANGVISALPYLVQAVTSWVASYISDRIVKKDKYQLSWVRKGFNSVGKFGERVANAFRTIMNRNHFFKRSRRSLAKFRKIENAFRQSLPDNAYCPGTM